MFTGDEQADLEFNFGRDSSIYSYENLKDLDPVAANRIHPNNQRKVGFQLWNYLGPRIYIIQHLCYLHLLFCSLDIFVSNRFDDVTS